MKQGDLVPTFWVRTVHTKTGDTPIDVYNSKDYFDLHFELENLLAGTSERVEVILCNSDEYINGTYWDGFS